MNPISLLSVGSIPLVPDAGSRAHTGARAGEQIGIAKECTLSTQKPNSPHAGLPAEGVPPLCCGVQIAKQIGLIRH